MDDSSGTKSRLTRSRWTFAAAIAVVALAGVALTTAALLASPGSPSAATPAVPTPTTVPGASPSPTQTPSPTPTPTAVRHTGILDGVPMTDGEWAARKDLLPIAVMVDNNPNAYPHAGLDRADLVYEALVEGAITRFMAVYWRQEAAEIYPVRSARTPFLVWASELGALYGHAGSATTYNEANAAGQIDEWGILDLDAFLRVSDAAYYRMNERYAPHNLVAVTTKLREAAAALGYKGTPAVPSWLYKDDGAGTASYPLAGGIDLDFHSQRFASSVIQWHWDDTSRSWLRFQSGGAHLDAITGKQLHATNVVVMRVPYEVVDNSGHVVLSQFGEGPASVFVDGREIAGKWKKQDRTSRTRFYDMAGREIALNRGTTWIEVLGPESAFVSAATPKELPRLPSYAPPVQFGQADEEEDEPAPFRPATSTAAATASPNPPGSPSPTATIRGGSPTASPGPGSPTTAPGSRTPTPGSSATAVPSGSAVTGTGTAAPSSSATATAATATAAASSTPAVTGTAAATTTSAPTSGATAEPTASTPAATAATPTASTTGN